MPRPLSHLATIANLAFLGVVGPGVLAALASLLAIGIVSLPALGAGLLVLAALSVCVAGVAAVERLRARGLHGTDVQGFALRTSTRTDWLRVPATIGLQLVDPSNLRAVLHLAIATVLGIVTLGACWALGFGAIAAFAPLSGAGPQTDVPIPVAWWPLVGSVIAIVAIATLVGLSFAHRATTRALLVPNREAALVEQAEVATQQRAGAVRAADLERTRIERDLHDGVQPRLVSIAMTLGMARGRITTDPAAAVRLVEEAHVSTKAAITELRQLARGIHPSVLDDRGLDAALSALAARSHVQVDLDVHESTRRSREAETAVYFVVSEALTNAAKHARAERVRVTIRERDDSLWARIVDDGVGGAVRVPGGGLDGIALRVLAVGGTFLLDSPQQGPTTVEVTIPCAS